jgi:predicted alpha-1,6-mannanase (GH76 family)
MKTLLVSLALLCACSADATGTDEDTLAADTRAHDATAALLAHFWDGGDHYLRGASNSGTDAGYWIFAETFDAVGDAAQRTQGKEDRAWLSTLFHAQDARGWKRDFFDDENWMALALIRAYDVTSDHTYLSRAESLFADIQQSGRTNTGVWWNRAHTQKATASNFGPAITAARLNERTGNPAYKTAAVEIYDYWYSHMVNHATFQVADHENANGTIDWSKWTYDTGLAIGASIELWKITGNPAYRSHAYALGDYLITHQVTPSQYGSVLYDANCSGDCHMFKGIAFRYLAKLWSLDETKTQYHDVLKASLRAIWYDAKSAQTLFGPSWTTAPPNAVTLAADTSAVMALNLAAEYGL